MAAYRRVYDSRHLQADYHEPGSAPEPYARQSSMGYLYVFNLTTASVDGVCAIRRRPLTAVSVVTRAFDGHIVGPSVMWTAGRHASDCCADQSDVIIHAKKRGSAVAEGPRDSPLHGIFFAP